MTITARQRQDGKTSYTVQVFNKHLGKKVTVGTFYRKANAESAQRQAMVEIQNQGFVSKFKDTTVGDMIERHLKAKSNIGGNTAYNYGLFLRRFKEFVGEGESINAVTTEDVESFVTHMVQSGFAGSVINLNINAVSAMFKTAIRYRYITVNPVDGIDNKPKNTGIKEVRALSIDEHNQLVAAVPEHFRLMVESWPYLAARPSEMYGLQNRDFDRKQKTLRIERQYKKSGGYGPLKHEAKPRTLYLDNRTAGLIAAQLKRNQSKAPEAPLFPSYRGGPIDRSWFPSKVFRDAKNTAGIEGDVTPHSLRHTGATWLLESGASVMYVAKHLGHSNPVITMKNYASLLDSVDKSAMSHLQLWYKESTKAATEEEAKAVAERARARSATWAARREREKKLATLEDELVEVIAKEGLGVVMQRLKDSRTTTNRLHFAERFQKQDLEQEQ